MDYLLWIVDFIGTCSKKLDLLVGSPTSPLIVVCSALFQSLSPGGFCTAGEGSVIMNKRGKNETLKGKQLQDKSIKRN